MKKYDLVIFGATFYAAGICSAYKGSTLIIESKTKPGYEFIDAYHPGNVLEYTPVTKQGRAFVEYLKENNLFDDPYILRWTPYISKKLLQISGDCLLLTDLVSVKECDEGFVITIFNTMGKSEILAQRIIDTRTIELEAKTINLLLKGKTPSVCDRNTRCIMKYMDYSIYEINLNVDDDYPSARKKAVESFDYLRSLCEEISLVAIADEFYKKAKEAQKETAPGYIICASSYYDNPIEAYDMGAKKGEEIQ